MIFGIDFDGTIVEDKWPEIGEPKQKVVDYIKQLQDKGHKWVLLTCRHDDGLISALTWLFNHGLYPAAVNDNTTEKIAEFNSNPRKVYADIYIDDHNAGGVYLPPLDGYMDFASAVRIMKSGRRIQRTSWKNYKAFIYLRKNKFGRVFLVLHTMDKMPEKEWMPSLSDLLAEDWAVIE